MPRLGKNQRKILLLLEAGAAIALSGSPHTAFRVIRALERELKRMDAEELRASIRRLYRSRLIDARDQPDGSTVLTLNEEGKRRVLAFKINEMSIRSPKLWDGKWRVILFDIPEKRRKIRDALRRHFHELGCHEFQKSVFVHPYECHDEIDFLIEFYQARPFVRFIIADEIDNALHLKRKFRLR